MACTAAAKPMGERRRWLGLFRTSGTIRKLLVTTIAFGLQCRMGASRNLNEIDWIAGQLPLFEWRRERLNIVAMGNFGVYRCLS
jgi:hypothetical protein